ncbi:MAG: hypothetical protein U9O83_04660, partial [Campylobacterota bacterium]|nr:hypothetical protein [Campylobacterota bacterium]
MTKFIQAFLTGIFITFILDFFIFLGIFSNYIKYHEIDVYYSILFWDYQNIYIYLILSAIFGFLVTYINRDKLSLGIVGLLFLLSLSTLIHSVGNSLGEMIFMKKNVTYKDARYSYVGDVYYNGREKITFYDYELKKIILLNKKE